MSILELAGITKSFGECAALRNISFSIDNGERVLLLGHNGAGKSTLLRICAGLSRQDSGTVLLQDEIRGMEWRVANVGYLSQHMGLYEQLSVAENLAFFASLRKSGPNHEETGARWGLEKVWRRRCGALSKGMRYRVGLAVALMHEPSLVLLDEPTASLDDYATEKLAEWLRAAGRTALIASHDVHRLLPLTTRAVLLEDGRVKGDSRSQSGVPEIIGQYQTSNR